MIFSWTHLVVIAFCSASIVVQSFGELLLLRHPMNQIDSSRKLTCVSEDDDSALIWNYNPISNDPNEGSRIFTNFKPERLTRKDDSECALWNSNKCSAKWENTEGWELVNSSSKPMGPVFDFRWEGFQESVSNIDIRNQEYQYMGEVSKSSGSTVFSVRGTKDVHVFLCEHIKPITKGLCFWILLCGWGGTKSMIRTCPNGAPPDKNYLSRRNCEDGKAVEHKVGEVINEYQWSTFTLKWSEQDRTIQVFKDTDREHTLFLEREIEKWAPVSHISMRYDKSARIRFHFYQYLLTEKNHVKISTEEFILKDFCVELLVGLCPKCIISVNFVDDNRIKISIGSIAGMENDSSNELLTWRTVKLNSRFENPNREKTRLEIRTFSYDVEGRGQWAIDHLRMCKPAGQIRQSSILAPRNTLGSSPAWHEVRCQKLSYNKSAVINSLSTDTVVNHTGELQHYIQDLVDSCGSSCPSLDKYWSLCYVAGCTCGRGFNGRYCSKDCLDGYYGYNCDAKCEPCHNGFCNRSTGLCSDIEEPYVENITDTTATIRQKIELSADIVPNITVVIRTESGTFWKKFTMNLVRPGIPSIYEAHLSNLIVDSIYQANAVVSIERAGQTITMSSPKIGFTTTCYGNPNFAVTRTEETFTVNIENEVICENADSPDYLMRVYDPVKNYEEVRNPVFPVIFADLIPYTEYEVIISNTGAGVEVFNHKFRTLESAPPEVQNLNVISVNQTDVRLQWDLPKEMNGIIKNFSIFITVVELLGCRDLKRPSPQQNFTLHTVNTTADITGLHPYAKYNATVTAYNTIRGEPKSYVFETESTLIPTSKVSKVWIDEKNTTLHWNAPEDCTTITGTTKYTKLIFSNGVNSTTAVKKFDLTNLTLATYTSYNVHVHVTRGSDASYNLTSYQELTWRTPPAPPPAVEKVEIYEADHDTGNISLRWKPPHPANGELELYRVLIYKNSKEVWNTTLPIPEEGLKCRLWDEYVCFENLIIPEHTMEDKGEIEVYAMNKDVTKTGAPTTVWLEPEIYNRAPTEPENLTSCSKGNGIMTLTWTHPLFTASKIARFDIYVTFLNTTLQPSPRNPERITIEHDAKQNQKKYSHDLQLLTSTVYNVPIVAASEHNSSTRSEIKISVPGGVDFTSVEELRVTQNGASIEIVVPAVVNATVNTTVSLYVNGWMTCTKINSLTYSSPEKLTEWLAAEYQVQDERAKFVEIGTNHNHGVPWNCSLHFGEAYVIVLVVKDWYSGTTANLTSSSIIFDVAAKEVQISNLAWFGILPIGVICLLLVFIWYRNPRRVPEPPKRPSYLEIIPLSSTASNTSNSTYVEPRMIAVTQSQVGGDPLSTNLYSLPNDADSCAVSIEHFEEYTKRAATGARLYSQFMLLRKGLTRSCEYGKLQENMPKNRIENLVAYDDTRVVLEKIPGNPYSDYINASYIKGYDKEKAYIAAQGPKPNTVDDFWRMIWQEEVHVICMLTNVIEGTEAKCEKYWPDVGCGVKYGDLLVSNSNDQVFADYTFRTLELSYRQDTRKVTHLHYTSWPSLGVPAYPQSLVAYLKKLEQTPTRNGPVVVHCSNGDDRTGTIILCDICLHQAAAMKEIDLTAVITRMRDSRANMVGTLQQYVLAHIIMTESIVSSSTQIPCRDVLSKRMKELRMQLPSDVQRLDDTSWQEHALRFSAMPQPPTAEGEFPQLVSSLERPEPIYSDLFESKCSQFHAVSVDGLRVKKQYLASYLPTPLTLSDFWSFVTGTQTKLIIILQCSDSRDASCCDIIPEQSIVIPQLDIQVKNKTSFDEGKYFTKENVLIKDKSKEETETQSITVLTCKGWGRGENGKPPMPAALVSLWIASEKVARKEGQTLVLCHDGVTGCGMYLALSFLLERMAVEGECDIIAAVRAVRRSRSKFMQSRKQFEFLYDAAVNYAECFQTYANFS